MKISVRLRHILSSAQTRFSHWQLAPLESVEYQAWRHQFVLDRLQLCWKLAVLSFMTFHAEVVYRYYVKAVEFNQRITEAWGDAAIADQLRWIELVTIAVTAILLVINRAVQKTTWGKQHPSMVFLSLSGSLTLVYLVVATCFGMPVAPPGEIILVFFAQAILIPVRWQFHFVSQVVPLLYYFLVYSVLGLTQFKDLSIYSFYWSMMLLWSCVICNLGVYLYEWLKQTEFAAQQQLQTFLHSIAHDLRTPVIKTSLLMHSLLQQSERGKVTVDTSTLEQVLLGSDRLLRLMNSLLDAHQTGALPQRQPVNLHQLIDQLLIDLHALLTQHNVQVQYQIPDDLPMVKADPDHLWCVWCNLITNAVTHNPPSIQVRLGIAIQPHCLYCTVEDNGNGIPANQRDRLFERYARGSRYAPGLGLGLYICREIITAHGGQIGVISQVNQGSTFWFTLPSN